LLLEKQRNDEDQLLELGKFLAGHLWPTSMDIERHCQIVGLNPKLPPQDIIAPFMTNPAFVELLDNWEEQAGAGPWEVTPAFRDFQRDLLNTILYAGAC